MGVASFQGRAVARDHPRRRVTGPGHAPSVLTVTGSVLYSRSRFATVHLLSVAGLQFSVSVIRQLRTVNRERTLGAPFRRCG